MAREQVREGNGEGVAAGALQRDGSVTEQLPNATFWVQLAEGQRIRAHVSREMRKFSIRVLPGDKVVVSLSPYDVTRGSIVHRYK